MTAPAMRIVRIRWVLAFVYLDGEMLKRGLLIAPAVRTVQYWCTCLSYECRRVDQH